LSQTRNVIPQAANSLDKRPRICFTPASFCFAFGVFCGIKNKRKKICYSELKKTLGCALGKTEERQEKEKEKTEITIKLKITGTKIFHQSPCTSTRSQVSKESETPTSKRPAVRFDQDRNNKKLTTRREHSTRREGAQRCAEQSSAKARQE
jgi:hypothetical protein